MYTVTATSMRRLRPITSGPTRAGPVRGGSIVFIATIFIITDAFSLELGSDAPPPPQGGGVDRGGGGMEHLQLNDNQRQKMPVDCSACTIAKDQMAAYKMMGAHPLDQTKA